MSLIAFQLDMASYVGMKDPESGRSSESTFVTESATGQTSVSDTYGEQRLTSKDHSAVFDGYSRTHSSVEGMSWLQSRMASTGIEDGYSGYALILTYDDDEISKTESKDAVAKDIAASLILLQSINEGIKIAESLGYKLQVVEVYSEYGDLVTDSEIEKENAMLMGLISVQYGQTIYQPLTYHPTTRTESSSNRSWKWATVNKRIENVKNEPKISAHVYAEKYNLGKAIPTDEFISGDVTNIDECKYDIDVRIYECSAGVKDIKISTTVTCPWTYEVTSQCTLPKTYDRNGKYVGAGGICCIHGQIGRHTYTTQQTGTATATKTWDELFEYSNNQKFYDVPKSNIYKLTSASMSGSLISFSKTFDINIDNPGAQVLSNPVLTEPAIESKQFSKTIRLDRVSGYSTLAATREAAQRAANNYLANNAYNDAANEIRRIVNASYNSFKGAGDVNYNFKGMHVDWKSFSPKKPTLNKEMASGDKIIPLRVENGTYTHTGTASYEDGSSVSASTNTAVVHAPIVCNPKVTIYDETTYDQLIADDRFMSADPTLALDMQNIQLDTIGEIIIPDNNQTNLHPSDEDNYKNYGTRLYNSNQGIHKGSTTWGAVKDVKFPDFDVYIQDVNEKVKEGPDAGKTYKIKRTFLLKKGKWLSEMMVEYNQGKEPKDQIGWENVQRYVAGDYKGQGPSTVIRFVLPVWTEERKYDNIQTRVVAVNMPMQYSATMDPGDYTKWNKLAEEEWLNEENWPANMNSDGTPNAKFYVAKNNNIQLYVFGKIYDLQVNNSRDPDWINKVWSKTYQRDYIVSQEFPFGQAEQNRNPAYKYAPKLGYTFSFNFKTKGRKAGQMEISVEPEGFYFVSKDGGETKKVDLWYSKTVSNPNERYVKIDPKNTKDAAKLTTRITDAFLKVVPQEMTDSGRIYESEFNMWGNKYGNKGPYHYEKAVEIGKLSNLTLPHSLRLTFNNIAEYRGMYPYNEANKSGGQALYGREKAEGEIYGDAGGQDYLIGSVGRWYCGYTLPASTIAVENGDPNQDPKCILKNGYILVRMSIVAKSQDPGTSATSDRNVDLKSTFTKRYLKYTGPEYLNATDGGEYGLDWNPNSSSNLSTRNQSYIPILNNNTKQLFTYFEKEDFKVFLKDENPENTFSKSERKYKQVLFNKPQFEWLTGEQIKNTIINDSNRYKYFINYRLPHPTKGEVSSTTYAGAVAVFDADLRASQDYDLSGTH